MFRSSTGAVAFVSTFYGYNSNHSTLLFFSKIDYYTIYTPVCILLALYDLLHGTSQGFAHQRCRPACPPFIYRALTCR